ncbi:MAG: maleylpyruvate isomerase family mycothiol-dependent enzyme [Acidimicrobiia bacterium]
MPEPVVDLLASEFVALDALCGELDPGDWDRPTDLPGWSVRDNVAHVIGTERMLLGHEVPELPRGDYPHVTSALGEFNEAWVEAYRSHTGDEVLAAYRDVVGERLDALRAMSAEDFDRPGFTPVGEAPYRVFMRIRAFDIWMHEQDIRRAVGCPGSLDGPNADDAVDWLLRSAPMVVGKRAGASDGSSVVLELTGGVPRTVAIGVDGRAAVLDSVPEDPTARLTMASEVYCRLAGGRMTAADALADGLVETEGDAELAVRVLEALNVSP